MKSFAASPARSGFTLVELAIVLVIIGFLAGGVMVGKDLIAAATIRSQISQIEKFNTAVRTFQLKYNCIPGDCANASQFGFFSTGMNGSAGAGNGDGLIQDYWGGTHGGLRPVGEVLVFWRHLSDANLIEKNFGAGLISGGFVPSDVYAVQANLWFPVSKMGRGGYVVPYTFQGSNYYQLTATTAGGRAVVNGTGGYDEFAGSVTPLEAQSIDVKMDDGLPLSGGVQALAIGNAWYGQASVAGDGCSLAGAPVIYDTASPNGTSVNCGMSFRFQ